MGWEYQKNMKDRNFESNQCFAGACIPRRRHRSMLLFVTIRSMLFPPHVVLLIGRRVPHIYFSWVWLMETCPMRIQGEKIRWNATKCYGNFNKDALQVPWRYVRINAMLLGFLLALVFNLLRSLKPTSRSPFLGHWVCSVRLWLNLSVLEEVLLIFPEP